MDVYLVNDSSRRIETYDFAFRLPRRILSHDSAEYYGEVKSEEPNRREFRFDQRHKGLVAPRSGKNRLYSMEYCLTCGLDDAEAKTGFGSIVYEDVVEATVWINGQEYTTKKTLGELHGAP